MAFKGLSDEELAKILIERGFASRDQISEVQKIREQSRQQGDKPIGMLPLLRKKGYLEEDELEEITEIIDLRMIGKKIPGYKLITKLGEGSMGEVFKAVQKSMDRTVAIKTIHTKFVDRQDFVERFRREAKVAASLNHQNILMGYDFGEGEGLYYFAMEYVEGQTLQEYLEEEGVMDPDEAIPILRDMVDALEHADQHDLIHRDIKPENIMLTENGVPKLCDLGLAKGTTDTESKELTKTGQTLGTPYYMSPEQIEGAKHVDIRTDIYGLGTTFYHMLTGEVPYEGDTMGEIMKMHMKGDLKPLREVRPEIPKEVERVIVTMMEKDVEDRYQTPEEVKADLDQIESGEKPLHARALPVLSEETRRYLQIAGAAVLLIAVAAGVFLFWPQKEAGEGGLEAKLDVKRNALNEYEEELKAINRDAEHKQDLSTDALLGTYTEIYRRLDDLAEDVRTSRDELVEIRANNDLSKELKPEYDRMETEFNNLLTEGVQVNDRKTSVRMQKVMLEEAVPVLARRVRLETVYSGEENPPESRWDPEKNVEMTRLSKRLESFRKPFMHVGVHYTIRDLPQADVFYTVNEFKRGLNDLEKLLQTADQMEGEDRTQRLSLLVEKWEEEKKRFFPEGLPFRMAGASKRKQKWNELGERIRYVQIQDLLKHNRYEQVEAIVSTWSDQFQSSNVHDPDELSRMWKRDEKDFLYRDIRPTVGDFTDEMGYSSREEQKDVFPKLYQAWSKGCKRIMSDELKNEWLDLGKRVLDQLILQKDKSNIGEVDRDRALRVIKACEGEVNPEKWQTYRKRVREKYQGTGGYNRAQIRTLLDWLWKEISGKPGLLPINADQVVAKEGFQKPKQNVKMPRYKKRIQQIKDGLFLVDRIQRTFWSTLQEMQGGSPVDVSLSEMASGSESESVPESPVQITGVNKPRSFSLNDAGGNSFTINVEDRSPGELLPFVRSVLETGSNEFSKAELDIGLVLCRFYGISSMGSLENQANEIEESLRLLSTIPDSSDHPITFFEQFLEERKKVFGHASRGKKLHQDLFQKRKKFMFFSSVQLLNEIYPQCEIAGTTGGENVIGNQFQRNFQKSRYFQNHRSGIEQLCEALKSPEEFLHGRSPSSSGSTLEAWQKNGVFTLGYDEIEPFRKDWNFVSREEQDRNQGGSGAVRIPKKTYAQFRPTMSMSKKRRTTMTLELKEHPGLFGFYVFGEAELFQPDSANQSGRRSNKPTPVLQRGYQCFVRGTLKEPLLALLRKRPNRPPSFLPSRFQRTEAGKADQLTLKVEVSWSLNSEAWFLRVYLNGSNEMILEMEDLGKGRLGIMAFENPLKLKRVTVQGKLHNRLEE